MGKIIVIRGIGRVCGWELVMYAIVNIFYMNLHASNCEINFLLEIIQ